MQQRAILPLDGEGGSPRSGETDGVASAMLAMSSFHPFSLATLDSFPIKGKQGVVAFTRIAFSLFAFRGVFAALRRSSA
jgi:hypothetical protein